MPKTTHADFSVAELERILNERRATLRDLMKRRDTIQKELREVNREIGALQGANHERRTRNKISLRTLALDFLKKSKKGHTLAELKKMILDSGYKTTSTKFRNVLYQCLYNSIEVYHDELTGTYRYKEPPPKKQPPAPQ